MIGHFPTNPFVDPFSYKVPGMSEEMAYRLHRRQLGPKAAFDSSSERITMVPLKPGCNYLPKDQENGRCGVKGITPVVHNKTESRRKGKPEVRNK